MNNPTSMKDLAALAGNRLVPIRAGELAEAKIIQILKNRIIVDVGGLTRGFIPEQEFSPEVGDLKVGDKIFAYVLTIENDDGFVVLSLRRADKERVSKILHEKFEAGQPLQVKVLDANKGGLLCQFGDYEGFLPVSQLATSHYPKVAAGNREEILTRLRDLVGQVLQVKILTFEPQANKLIFSEKAAGDLLQQEKIKNLKIGDEFLGEITGVVDFGLFVKTKIETNDEVEGLVHISEISWEHVDDLKSHFKPGQKVKIQLINKDDDRLSFSIKRLENDPWLKLIAKRKVGEKVLAEVTKVTPFGAFVKVDGVEGLVHISELGDKIADPKEVVQEGKKYHFLIAAIDDKLHKLSLTYKTAVKVVKTKSSGKKSPAKKTVKDKLKKEK